MNAPNESDLLAAQATSAEKRRLSILDLMMAMAALAASLGIYREKLVEQSDIIRTDPFGYAVVNWPSIGITALTLWGIWLWLQTRYWARKNAFKPSYHPGHLLLFFNFAAIIWTLAVRILTWLFGEAHIAWADREPNFFLDLLSHSTMPLLVLIVALVGAFNRQWRSRWTLSFKILALFGFGMLVIHLMFLLANHKLISTAPLISIMNSGVFYFVNRGLPLLTLLFVIIAVTGDLIQQVRRDALHWIGLACGFATILGSSIWMLLFLIAEKIGL